MITCSKCGRENEDHYKFCLSCGNPLSAAPAPQPVAEPEPAPEVQAEPAVEQALAVEESAPAPQEPKAEFVTCPECAARVAIGQRFCMSCGAKVPDNSATVSAAAVPVASEAAPAPEPEPVAAATAEPQAAPQSNTEIVGELVMINPDGSEGESVQLHAGPNVIGRSSDAPVLQRDEYLSPEHATVGKVPDGFRIDDNNSINGTYYRTSGPVAVAPGDYIRMGQEVFLLQGKNDFPIDQGLAPEQGSSAGTIWGRLARVSGPEDVASSAFPLYREEHTIGRERGDFTLPDDGYVSGLHAKIYRENGQIFVEDLNSSNGTFIRIKETHTVPNGTLILMGKQPFRVKLY